MRPFLKGQWRLLLMMVTIITSVREVYYIVSFMIAPIVYTRNSTTGGSNVIPLHVPVCFLIPCGNRHRTLLTLSWQPKFGFSQSFMKRSIRRFGHMLRRSAGDWMGRDLGLLWFAYVVCVWCESTHGSTGIGRCSGWEIGQKIRPGQGWGT